MPTEPTDNPLLQAWHTPYGLPPFDRLQPSHFAPAFEQAMARHLAEIEAIAASAQPPGFDNTVVALDRSGTLLRHLEQLFENLCDSHSLPELQAVQREMAPRLAAHESAVYLHEGLFARLDTLHERRHGLGLDEEDRRLLERLHLDFVRAGARLSREARTRHAQITERLAGLYTAFSQAVLADESTWQLELAAPHDLEGLPPFMLDATREAALQRGLGERRILTLSRSAIESFLTFSTRRDLRETAWRAWTSRGEGAPERDTRPLVAEILALRLELARLHGAQSYAEHALRDRMAGTPAAATALLERVWGPAKLKAAQEQSALLEEAGDLDTLQPWDWYHYAERVRRKRYAVDDAEVKPYFRLDRMIEAMFDCAGRLFGVCFVEREGVPLYHPDVRLWEVRDRGDDRLVGVFLGDNHARPHKGGGAWMGHYRDQARQGDERTLPVVVNNNNFAKAAPGQPTLLSFADVRTLFHEFGHGLHGLLSDVRHRRLSGTYVLQDFLELPSQLFEHWALEPQVLRRHALHAETGEPIPEALIERLQAAQLFNQGFETVQYVGPALIDLALHGRTSFDGFDLAAFEREQIERLGLPTAVGMRHRLPHFGHLFSGDGYAAGYYVYLWAEVLDADAYQAFVEAGDIFDREVAGRLQRYIYGAGASIEPGQAYRAFRGRDARVEAMLAKRGLLPA
ncbi:M3 family metallopeptidase [Caldimonas brevitalea]|uniref:Peptidase M3 n=1 Tax=Caldimonas brevitalea TaxID=413882 RepID=A0A0G3BUU0_9BURK|nr:M3 family metallopeptidase [Caldimonas brevitalea]AKJ30265.1 peptidase M3 [Caldimonas brevitalea]